VEKFLNTAMRSPLEADAVVAQAIEEEIIALILRQVSDGGYLENVMKKG
jgi:hypothetical protein